jgi:hypothetical protein
MLQTMAFAISQVMPQAVRTGLFVSTCSVLQPDGHLDTSGAPSGAFAAVASLTSIPCVNAVPGEGSIAAKQDRAPDQIQTQAYRHVALAGYYYDTIFPLLEEGLVADVTDALGVVTRYNLRNAEPDSQGTQTRLTLEVTSV